MTPHYVLMAVTTSARLLNDNNTFEQILRPFTRKEFSIDTSHRVPFARCAPHVIYRFVIFFFGSQVSAFSELLHFQQVMDRLSSSSSTASASTASSIDDFFGHNMWNPLLDLLFPRSTPTSGTSTWPKSHSLVTLLLIYSVTRRRCSSLHADTMCDLSIEFLTWCGTTATLVTSTF